MRQTNLEKIAAAIMSVVRAELRDDDEAIAAINQVALEAGLPFSRVRETLEDSLGLVWGKMPAGYMLTLTGHVEAGATGIIVKRTNKPLGRA